MQYGVKQSHRFKRSFRKVSQYPEFDRAALQSIVELLRKDIPLDSKYRDHLLKGEFAGVRECHIRNDLLLLYQKQDDILILLLVDIGTHASMFGK